MTVPGAVAGPVTTIEFDEFDERARTVRLTAEAAGALSRTGLVRVAPAGRGHWSIAPRGRVGSVRVPGLAVRVLPRADLDLTRLFFLLDHADPGVFLDQAVSASSDDRLWSAVAESLAGLAESALAAGPLRGYRRVDDAISTVRGRIRLGDQIRRRPGMSLPLEVTYSEFTPDIAENRILRTALHRLQFLPDLRDSTRRRLGHLSARLGDVEILGMGTAVPSWTATRLNARYQGVLPLADRVVRSMSVETDQGRASSAAFVTEMPPLFERFVRAELARELRAPGEKLLADPVVYLETGDPATDVEDRADRIPVRTGLVYSRDGRPVTTVVAGYPRDARDLADEHYRLLAACTALGVRRAYLVYPADRSGTDPRPRRIVHTDISIVEYPVVLSAGPTGAREALGTLARQARTVDPVQNPAPRKEGDTA